MLRSTTTVLAAVVLMSLIYAMGTPRRSLAQEDGGIPGAGLEAGSGHLEFDQKGEKPMTANFRFAPWPNVLKWYADEMNLVLDLGEVPPGTFNYYSEGELTATELLDVFNGYLLPREYLLVRRDNFLVCVNIAQGVPPNLVPHVTPDELDDRGRNELLSVLIPVPSGSATELAREFEELLGPQGRIAAMEANQSLAIIDIGSNLRRIVSIVHGDDAGAASFQAFSLQHITAVEAEATIRTLLDGDNSATAGGRTSGNPFGGVSAALARATASKRNPLQLSIDRRSNRLFAVGSRGEMRVIRQILDSIDVPSSNSGSFVGDFRVLPAGPQDELAALERLLAGLSSKIRVTSSSTADAGRSGSAMATRGPPDRLGRSTRPDVPPPTPANRASSREDPE